MCLAVPGKVLDVQGEDPLIRTARVSFAGVVKTISLACAPEAVPGDYVLVHVGVAISIVDQKEAEQTYAYLRTMGELDGLDRPPVGDQPPQQADDPSAAAAGRVGDRGDPGTGVRAHAPCFTVISHDGIQTSVTNHCPW